MKKIILSGIVMMLLSACNGMSSETDMSSLYSGSDSAGSWFHAGASCVAGICPAN